MNGEKALSPVVASIILIAVAVAVSVAVATWMGSITLSFWPTRKAITVNVPLFQNATVVYVDDNSWGSASYEGWHKLPYSFNITLVSGTLNIKCAYYIEVNPQVYQKIGEETFTIKSEGV